MARSKPMKWMQEASVLSRSKFPKQESIQAKISLLCVMGMNNELVRFILWEQTGRPGQKAAGLLLPLKVKAPGGTPREKRKGHCSHAPLTLNSWLAISSLAFHANGILISLATGAQQSHKMFKITIYFCGNDCAIIEYSGFPRRVRTSNLEKTWALLASAHATIKQTEVGWGSSVSASYLDAPYR